MKKLGVGCIWLSPILKSPMADFGYDVSNFREIDPMFGTMNDFDRLLRRAHALGKWKENLIHFSNRLLKGLS